jgi:Ca2+-binding EF-hand superfamily protein
MEFLIIAVIVAGIAYLFWTNNKSNPFDVNKDGKVDVKDVVAVVPTLTQKLDVNKDGKIDTKDVKAVASKAKTTVKATAAKTKAVVKNVKAKVAAKKVAVKKPTARPKK